MTVDRLMQPADRICSSIDLTPAILDQPLDQPRAENNDYDRDDDDNEPSPAKKPATETAVTIATRAARGEYTQLDHVARDIVDAVSTRIAQLKSGLNEDTARDPRKVGAAIIEADKFRARAIELLRRECAYPQSAKPANANANTPDADPDANQIMHLAPNVVLSIWGNAPHSRQLFSSLPNAGATPEHVSAASLAIRAGKIPPCVSVVRLPPARRDVVVPTLGELYRSPKESKPLTPPVPRVQPKGNILTYRQPDPWEPHKYKANSYFVSKLMVGHYLDYGNATPASQARTKQRERAQSLAGVRPSLDEVESFETDMLFRRAFSTFAPTRDDSNSVVPASVGARLWWRKAGMAAFDRMIRAECDSLFPGETDCDGDEHSVNRMDEDVSRIQDDDGDGDGGDKDKDNESHVDRMDEDAPRENFAPTIDDEAIAKAILEWDDSLVDPSLEAALGITKPEAEKTIDDKLHEVTDLIETLVSYQRIRNLVLPSSQTRAEGAPVNHDMLAHGSVPQPSDEEMATYQALKSRLASIISSLPPYVISKLGGRQTGELLVSTKLQVTSEEFEGVMESENQLPMVQSYAGQPQQQQQQQQQAAAGTPVAPRISQRAPNGRASTAQHAPFTTPQQNRTPIQPSPYGGYSRQQPPQTVGHQLSQRTPATTYRSQQPQEKQANGYLVNGGYGQPMDSNQQAPQPVTPMSMSVYPPGYGPPRPVIAPPQPPTPGARGYPQQMQLHQQQQQPMMQHHHGYAQGNHPGSPVLPVTPGLGGGPPQHSKQLRQGLQYMPNNPALMPPNRTASPQLPQAAQMRNNVSMSGQPFSPSPVQNQQRLAPPTLPQRGVYQYQMGQPPPQQQQQPQQHQQAMIPQQPPPQMPMPMSMPMPMPMQPQPRPGQGPPLAYSQYVHDNKPPTPVPADIAEKARLVAQEQQQLMSQQRSASPIVNGGAALGSPQVPRQVTPIPVPPIPQGQRKM